MSQERELHFRDVFLLPNYSEVHSRSDVDTSIYLRDKVFKLPVLPANMKSIMNPALAKILASNGYLYIMHRFDIDIVQFCNDMMYENLYCSISVGVNADSYEVLDQLLQQQISPFLICVDTAHGHAVKMKQMISYLKEYFPDTLVCAGNVCTEEGVLDLQDWGADIIKVGIGSGAVCSTKLKTGFSRPQFSAVKACAEVSRVPIISDGGIEEIGDIAKALVAGASIVMAGRLFADCYECNLPFATGGKLDETQAIYTDYFGSASAKNKNSNVNIEGFSTLVKCTTSIERKMSEISQGLKSAISYAGGHDLSAFDNVKYVVQS